MNARQKAKYYKRKYEQIANQSMESLVKEVRRCDVDTLELNRLYSDREIEEVRMKEGFIIWIPDDAKIHAINIAIMVKDEKTNGLTMFNLTEDQIRDCAEWYFLVDSKALPVKNGEC